MDDLVADVDAVVAVDGADVCQGDDERAVHAHEALRRQHVFHGFHGEVADESLALAVNAEDDVVLHSVDVENAVEGYLAQFAVHLDEDGGGFGRGSVSLAIHNCFSVF